MLSMMARFLGRSAAVAFWIGWLCTSSGASAVRIGIPAPPVSTDPPGSVVYVKNGSEILSIRVSGGLEAPEFGVTIRRLVLADSETEGLQSSAADSLPAGDLVILGPASDLEALTGKRPADLAQAEEVLALSGSMTATESVASLRVGKDAVALHVARGTREVSFEVNGQVGPSLGALAPFVVDEDRFTRAIRMYALVLSELDSAHSLSPPVIPEGCFFPCLQCGAAVTAWVSSFPALAACMTAVGCLPAIGYHLGTDAALVAACGECGVCRNQDDAGKGGGTGDTRPGPGGCPRGYHECPGNTCCSNDGGGECCPCAPVCACGGC